MYIVRKHMVRNGILSQPSARLVSFIKEKLDIVDDTIRIYDLLRSHRPCSG